MKWTTEQTEKLKDLAYAGLANKDIAAQLGIHINDVYAKRSQLGITIDKVKTSKSPENIVPVTKESLLKDLLRWFEEGIKDGFKASGQLCKEVCAEIRQVLKQG